MTRSTLSLLAMTLSFSATIVFLAEAESQNRKKNYYSLIFTEAPNTPPVIDPVIKQKIKWSKGSVFIDATVTDNTGNPPVYKWTQLDGPDDVEFSPDDTEDTTVTFPAYGGSYLLQLSVSDGEFTVTAEVTITYDFLRNYKNTNQIELPADRIYPMGQKMMLTPWIAQTRNDLQDIKNHGFTMFGPLWDTRESVIEPIFQNAKEIGELRAAHKIGDGYGLVYKLCPALDGGDKEARMWKNVESNIKRVVNDPLYNDMIDVWLQGTEEISTRFHQCDKTKLINYIQKFKQMVETHDPQKRPLWMSDTTGVTADQMAETHRWLDMVGPQMYIEGIGSPGHYEHNVIMNRLADHAVKIANAMDRTNPVMRPRAKTGSLGALYEPIPERDNLDFIRKHTMHDMFLGFNRGMNGFQFYSWYNYTGDKYSDEQTFQWYKTAYKESVKLLTDNGLDYAYLWGDRRDDLTAIILRGPERIQWFDVNAQYHDYPTISMQNIQYGDERFVMLTNSGTDAVQVKIDEFPVNCVKVLDILDQTYKENTGWLTTTLQPLDVRLYRFKSEADCTP